MDDPIDQDDLLKDPDLRQAVTDASADGADEEDPLAGSASNSEPLDIDEAYKRTHGRELQEGEELGEYLDQAEIAHIKED